MLRLEEDPVALAPNLSDIADIQTGGTRNKSESVQVFGNTSLAVWIRLGRNVARCCRCDRDRCCILDKISAEAIR